MKARNVSKQNGAYIGPLSRAGFVQIMLVEIPNVFYSVLEVLSRLPGAVLCCPFVANPFHKILKFLAVEATIQDG